MEDKKRGCVWGTGRNERGGGKKECVATLASLLYVTRATAACRPACLPACDPSIPGVSLIVEARALGQPGYTFTSKDSTTPCLSFHFLFFALTLPSSLIANCKFLISVGGFTRKPKNVGEIKHVRFSFIRVMSRISCCICGVKWKAASQTGNMPH